MNYKFKTLQIGVTLIEVFIVMAIIGVLSAIAIPAMSDQLIKSGRSRAQTDLYQLQMWIEQQYTSEGSYPSTIECSTCQLSDKYNYSIVVGSSANNAYQIKATPNTTSIQKNDTECYTMVINAVSEQSNQSKDGTNVSNDKCWI